MYAKQLKEKMKVSVFWEYLLECKEFLVRNRKLLYFSVVMILCATMSFTALLVPYAVEQQASHSNVTNAPDFEQNIIVPADIYVHIAGAVQHPGLYTLKAGDHVIDAVQAAGGFTQDALQDGINQAALLSDGQMLVIPSENGDTAAQAQAERTSAAVSAVVNLNTATLEQLMTLPGIGETKANNIMKYRELAGSFKTIEDLLNVEGIGPGIFQKLQGYITV